MHEIKRCQQGRWQKKMRVQKGSIERIKERTFYREGRPGRTSFLHIDKFCAMLTEICRGKRCGEASEEKKNRHIGVERWKKRKKDMDGMI